MTTDVGTEGRSRETWVERTLVKIVLPIGTTKALLSISYWEVTKRNRSAPREQRLQPKSSDNAPAELNKEDNDGYRY